MAWEMMEAVSDQVGGLIGSVRGWVVWVGWVDLVGRGSSTAGKTQSVGGCRRITCHLHHEAAGVGLDVVGSADACEDAVKGAGIGLLKLME